MMLRLAYWLACSTDPLLLDALSCLQNTTIQTHTTTMLQILYGWLQSWLRQTCATAVLGAQAMCQHSMPQMYAAKHPCCGSTSGCAAHATPEKGTVILQHSGLKLLRTTSKCISPLISMASKLSQAQGMRGKSTSNCSSKAGQHTTMSQSPEHHGA